METIINPISKDLLKAELTEEKRMRHTNRGGNNLYIIDAHDSPNVMLEIGRLREIAFRASGGGTGKSVDIDEYDTMEVPYKQLVVWNPDAEEIIGGYRYIGLALGVWSMPITILQFFSFSSGLSKLGIKVRKTGE